MMKRIISFVLALLVISTFPLPAFAHEAVDLDKEGSITLELKFEGEPVIGGKFSCVKVADIVCEDGNYYYKTLLEEKIYRNGIPELEHIQELVKNNRTSFRDHKLTLSNTTGILTFESRKPGLYLIMQDTEARGYSLMNDFLVSLPYLEDGTYVYDVTAKTKPALEPDEIETEPVVDKDDKLPQTGQLNWPVPVMAVTGLALCVFGWSLSRKKEGYEE